MTILSALSSASLISRRNERELLTQPLFLSLDTLKKPWLQEHHSGGCSGQNVHQNPSTSPHPSTTCKKGNVPWALESEADHLWAHTSPEADCSRWLHGRLGPGSISRPHLEVHSQNSTQWIPLLNTVSPNSWEMMLEISGHWSSFSVPLSIKEPGLSGLSLTPHTRDQVGRERCYIGHEIKYHPPVGSIYGAEVLQGVYLSISSMPTHTQHCTSMCWLSKHIFFVCSIYRF